MTRQAIVDDGIETLADLYDRMGNIPPARICFKPPPGTATERDLIRLNDRGEGLYELVEGTLVRKPVGQAESLLAMEIGRLLGNWLEGHDLGYLTGEAGGSQLMPGVVRLPDVSFFSWAQLPEGQHLKGAVARIPPALAVEVLSPSNSRSEMSRKLREYFLAGTKLVWYVDPKSRTVRVYSSPESHVTHTETDTLGGGDVLPGFALALARLFARLPSPDTKANKPPKRNRR